MAEAGVGYGSRLPSPYISTLSLKNLEKVEALEDRRRGGHSRSPGQPSTSSSPDQSLEDSEGAGEGEEKGGGAGFLPALVGSVTARDGPKQRSKPWEILYMQGNMRRTHDKLSALISPYQSGSLTDRGMGGRSRLPNLLSRRATLVENSPGGSTANSRFSDGEGQDAGLARGRSGAVLQAWSQCDDDYDDASSTNSSEPKPSAGRGRSAVCPGGGVATVNVLAEAMKAKAAGVTPSCPKGRPQVLMETRSSDEVSSTKGLEESPRQPPLPSSGGSGRSSDDLTAMGRSPVPPSPPDADSDAARSPNSDRRQVQSSYLQHRPHPGGVAGLLEREAEARAATAKPNSTRYRKVTKPPVPSVPVRREERGTSRSRTARGGRSGFAGWQSEGGIASLASGRLAHTAAMAAHARGGGGGGRSPGDAAGPAPGCWRTGSVPSMAAMLSPRPPVPLKRNDSAEIIKCSPPQPGPALPARARSTSPTKRHRPHRQRLLEDEYEVDGELGSGASGTVQAVRHRRTGVWYAAKVMDMKSSAARQDALDEISMGMQLRHAGVVEMVDMFLSMDEVVLVLELMPGGDIQELLHDVKQLSEAQARAVLKQLVPALRFMHTQRLVHCDVKPDNVLMDDPADLTTCKLADLGLAKELGVDGNAASFETCGTIGFMAPEILQSRTGALRRLRYSAGRLQPAALGSNLAKLFVLLPLRLLRTSVVCCVVLSVAARRPSQIQLPAGSLNLRTDRTASAKHCEARKPFVCGGCCTRA
mmetsp:Transcript_64760/g.204480  ORF Transcript_64760/g.204480 Transcript_64760/m.204480 type:complete len:758 (-) Transcript_64760:795-3068(-)